MLPNPDYLRRAPFDKAAASVDDALRAEAMRQFRPAFDERLQAWAKAPKRDFVSELPGERGKALKAFQRDGVVGLALRKEVRAELARLAEPALDAARQSAAGAVGKVKFRDANVPIEPTDGAALYRLVADMLVETGALEIASVYAGCRLELRKVFAQVNDAPRTEGKYGVIEADGLPRNKAAYWHIDSTIYPPTKLLVYLNDVGPEQGPFRYVAGSHLAAGDQEMVIRKTNDSLRLKPQLFMALPEQYRMQALFGDHLDPESAEVKGMLARERTVLSSDGDVMLFDNHGVHRGGFVRAGTRTMLQLLLQPASADHA